MPSRIATTQQLRDAQQFLGNRVSAPETLHELPLPASTGRILARTLDILDTNGHGGELAAGTRIDWYLLPLLAASGHCTVPTFATVRCGIVSMQAATCQADQAVVAITLQAALEKMGVKSVGANVTTRPLEDRSSLELFAKHCDVLLVIDQAAQPPVPGAELAPPLTFDVDGRPCFVLPTCPLAALGMFLAFIVPLIRTLQGRSTELPPLRSAVAADPDGEAFPGHALVCVSATGHGDAIRVRPCAPLDGRPVQGISDVSGIAWCADDLRGERDGLLAYLPLADWLQ
ncbi:MAG: hypothetical protein DI603_18065 [Roseateles depolymerans]|uniref:Molybdopterin molybdenumtransferase n=1 Tax=Roseateles depolymerans TaxID=76731 RepID=A0A2W5DKB4_9BURK|nr:MAG: hypothetical protein DI603_18065 [Roseateles depolymerans]